MKVFIGFANIAGFASRLGTLLARAGHEVVWINSAPDYRNPTQVEQEGLREIAPRWFRFSNLLKDRFRPLYVVLTPLLYVGKLAVFLSALRRSEVMLFLSCGRILPWYLDRRLAKWYGRRTINISMGSASRPVIIGGSGIRMAEQSEKKLRKIAKKMRRQRRHIRQIAAICDEILENPLASHFQPRPCIDWFRIGFPSGSELFTTSERAVAERTEGRVVVLHCPSKPRVKGTDRIREAIAALQNDGLPIEFVQITGKPHAEVLAHLNECDFVIDQLYSDAPLSGFSTEAASFGKPAVIGGYGWEILRRLPSGERLAPTVLCHPDEIEQTVRELVENEEKREETGAKAKEYCDGFLGGAAFVERFERLLRGDVPDDWRFDPRDICYLHGLGQNEEELRAGLRRYLQRFGRRGLCFDEREDLVRAVEEFVAE